MSKSISAYAAISTNAQERIASSSGGIFSLLAKSILSDGGVVYGVTMSDDCLKAEFIRVADVKGLAKLRGSKYLQASIGMTFKQVMEDLKSGISVLFSGTACQINGLVGFLSARCDAEKTNEKYTNLYCVDVICHGVPSPALWKAYVSYVEKEKNARLINVNFRCKDKSWTDFCMKEIDENQKQVYISKDKDPYMQMFLRDYCLRPSCYKCIARKIRCSDITIADFWGINNVAPEMNDEKGTSLVLVRTEKGQKFFDQIADSVMLKKVSYKEGVKSNSAEYKSPTRPLQRDTFFSDMRVLSFSDMERKYVAPLPIPLKRKIKGLLKKIILLTPARKLICGGLKIAMDNMDCSSH